MTTEPKTLYIVTRGDIVPGPNPKMTLRAQTHMSRLRRHLPKDPFFVICGKGQRHVDTAAALNLIPLFYTPLIGDTAYIGHDNEKTIVILPDGQQIDPIFYVDPLYNLLMIKSLFRILPGETVVCTGSLLGHLLKLLNLTQYELAPASVYKIFINHDDIWRIEQIAHA